MSTTKHSPAPWTYNKNRVAIEAAPDENGEQVTVLYVRGAMDNPKDDLPLILEAPALLAALKHIAGHWEAAEQEGNEAFALDMASCETCKQLALTAIARAEGRA